jgi:hypothetical protein
MRIAVSGSHATGKSTLVRELLARISDLTAVDEAYYVLAEQGHVFGDPPTFDDFELLFEHSAASMVARRAGPVVFDRSPADYLAYLATLRPGVSLSDEVSLAGQALATLDLVVYVPIERPDRIDVTESPRLRRQVDATLRDMLVNQAWGFAVRTIEVQGTPRERASQIAGLLRPSHS